MNVYKRNIKNTSYYKCISNYSLIFIRKKCQSIDQNIELSQGYVPSELESTKINKTKIYSNFLPKEDPSKVFSMIFPPPNITGDLHLGHAMTCAIQDSIIRWKKMNGFCTKWIPGLDHAGIATQVVVEKVLFNEFGKTRHDFGREMFIKEILKWKDKKAIKINKQLEDLNVCLDFDKQIFTMDDNISNAVNTAFIQLFDKNLIYRADHLVNWSCVLQSAISDIEVEHINIEKPTRIVVPNYEKSIEFGFLYKFAYKFENNEEIVVATTRPETMLGDVAIAVNPNDTRYQKYIGQRVIHPFRNNETIPIISDEFVDTDFGTGAVKLTPAHDLNDFEVARKHENMPILKVIDENGNLTNICGQFENLKRFEARDVILNELSNLGLYRGKECVKTVLPICSRSKDVVELILKPQWFLNCKQMAQRALDDVKTGKLHIIPSNYEKVWTNWLENIRDWCISRQLWWGHRIPVYLCKNGGKFKYFAAKSENEALQKAVNYFKCNENDVKMLQDNDVLDTWFSSALQPFTAFGWPNIGNDFDKYYPISLMETGHDILFFWVARMVMLGTELTGKLPFDRIFLHGIICDSRGRKMSKSLGNVIDPEYIVKGCSLEKLQNDVRENHQRGIISKSELDLAIKEQKRMFPQGIPECGTDALKFTLLTHNVKNQFINFDINECYANKLFCNKIWQATKFTIFWTHNYLNTNEIATKDFDIMCNENTFLPDRWILSRLTFLTENYNESMENYDFHFATTSLKKFIYNEFCDIYLESVKRNLKESNEFSKNNVVVLVKCLEVAFKLLYPFMPVLSQHLHSHLPLLNISKDIEFRNRNIEREFDDVMEIVSSIRRIKKMFNITFKYQPEAHVLLNNNNKLLNYNNIIKDLASLYKFKMHTTKNTLENIIHTKNSFKDKVNNSEIYINVPKELKESLEVDLNKIKEKEEKILNELNKLNKMISGENYLQKASLESQEVHSRKVNSLNDKLTRLKYLSELLK